MHGKKVNQKSIVLQVQIINRKKEEKKSGYTRRWVFTQKSEYDFNIYAFESEQGIDFTPEPQANDSHLTFIQVKICITQTFQHQKDINTNAPPPPLPWRAINNIFLVAYIYIYFFFFLNPEDFVIIWSGSRTWIWRGIKSKLVLAT